MIVTENLFKIEDKIEALVQTILESNPVKDYRVNKQKLGSSSEAKEKQKQFLATKEAFERIESFGKFAPDFREKRVALRKAKRILDLDPDVADFRVSELEVQTMLDAIGLALAKTISKDIKVDAGNPFFMKGKHSGCGGNCHAS